VNGIRYTPADTTGHLATPVPGSYTVEEDGGPANLLADADYPVIAICNVCRGRIKLDHKLQMEWRHAPQPAASAKGAS
jgi:hypothetical protein